MSENYKRVEKHIKDTKYNYLEGWEGIEYDSEVQEEMLDYILMYIIQKQIHENIPYLPQDIWVEKSKPIINDHAFFYAIDVIDDLSILYEFEILMDAEDSYLVEKVKYMQAEKLNTMYELYVDYIRNGAAGNERIYKFTEEMLKDQWVNE
ncbi:Hypothetical predicted protein [Paramuricea clavata]|uniref:Uncharacterized protein n=1 Tax=Paramuricea clavata TaxID=317549 RepID=A0A6S7FQC4_PARCT|nr:Hypothetical predicted protein [Paramuricea clavata]